MPINSRALTIAVLGLAVVGFSASSVPDFAQADPQAQPDNTKQNKEARSNDVPTADQQKETAADRDLSEEDPQVNHQRFLPFDLCPQYQGHRAGRHGHFERTGPHRG
jgi:hypothetical protein